MKAIEVQSPNKIPLRIFLGGSIEMGKAIDWQKQLIESLNDQPIIFLNPRRADWDSSWVQSIDNPEFKTQVVWELGSLEMSDLIVMVIDPNTLSPITLLEIGLHARSGKMIVCCPDGFWRKGNVDVVGEVYGYKVVETLDEIIDAIRNKINGKN